MSERKKYDCLHGKKSGGRDGVRERNREKLLVRGEKQSQSLKWADRPCWGEKECRGIEAENGTEE